MPTRISITFITVALSLLFLLVVKIDIHSIGNVFVPISIFELKFKCPIDFRVREALCNGRPAIISGYYHVIITSNNNASPGYISRDIDWPHGRDAPVKIQTNM